MSLATLATLDAVFNPRGIAVVGVSNRETNLGLRFTRALVRHGYPGQLVAVNRGGDDVEGLPGYRALTDIAGPVDLAIIAVNADAVEDAVDACVTAGTRAALVFTSGFAEVGADGVERQRRLVERAAAGNVRLLGPNCVGFANVHAHVCPIASGFGFRPAITPGSLAIVTQSGGVAGLLGERAQDIGIGLSHVVTTGNEADVTAAEVVRFLTDDPETREIALYLEAVREPQALADALAAASDAGVRVAIFKAGAGTSTAAAAAAHTGSVVGDDAAFDAFCRQVGALRVLDLDHLFLAPPIAAAASGVSHKTAPPATVGLRVGILSTSGGAAVAVADACERAGMSLPPLSDATAAAIAELAPGFASTGNPIDISGMFVVAMDQFKHSLDALLAAPEFDAVVMVQTVHPPELAERIADLVIEGADPGRMQILWIAGEQSTPARARLRAAGYAVSESATALAAGLRAAVVTTHPPTLRFPTSAPAPTPEPASATLARLRDVLPTAVGGASSVGGPSAAAGASPAGGACAAGGGASFGVPFFARVVDVEEAVRAADSFGYPVVLKADAAELGHKTERGGVIAGIGDAAGVHEAWTRLQAAGLDGAVLVQQQVSGFRELLLAARRDPGFGLVLAVGFGGVLTEAIGRTVIVLPPITPASLRDGLEAAGLTELTGPFRGAAEADLGALVTLGAALLDLAEDLGDVLHLELNPVIIDAQGKPWAVDALVDPGPGAA